MAKIVLGIGSSHGPLLNTPADEWGQRAVADKRNPELYYRGHPYTFDQLTEVRANEHFERELVLEKMQARYDACQRAVAVLADTLARVAPDVVLIVGDDQEEIFVDEGMPALGIYWGETTENLPISAEASAKRPPGLAIADWAYYPPEPNIGPGEPKLGRHLIESTVADGFDVAHYQRLPVGRHGTRGMPHAYGFVYRRLMNDKILPNVPIFINTFYPPNQPRLTRCYQFGAALGRAIASWDSDKTVAIVASGGLSHFVVEEDLDQAIIAALRENDERALLELPESHFESGTSETRNWFALAGALAGTDLQMHLIDYVPCYRSIAGTGNAMAFAEWK